jgi:hypothetical protein
MPMKSLNRLISRLTERNCFLLLVALFIGFSIAIALIPYDP